MTGTEPLAAPPCRVENQPQPEKPASKERRRRIRGHCRDCETPVTAYPPNRCRPCDIKSRTLHPDKKMYQREWHLRQKYGLEPGEFDALWIVHRGVCPICVVAMRMPTMNRGQPLDAVAVDHDHESGQVRGLLCNACNKGIGLFSENIGALQGAIRYLQQFGASSPAHPVPVDEDIGGRLSFKAINPKLLLKYDE